MPCISPITSNLPAVEMGDGEQYASSDDLAAFIGLLTRQYSTGSKANLLRISKLGEKTSGDYWFSVHGFIFSN